MDEATASRLEVFGPEGAYDSAHVRRVIRTGAFAGQTSGLAPGRLQANVVILPASYARDFLGYCRRNPQPCPVLAVSEAGSPALPALGSDLDIRTDVPRYRVFRDGELVDEPTSIAALWRDDLVTFALGCSFSFERALLRAGVPLRHVERGANVAMYRTSIATRPVGPFHGPLVVSMRAMVAAAAIRAVEITSRFPWAHGSPVHLGDPKQIGIPNLDRPDYGDALPLSADEMPVFWACGVTAIAAIERARPELCMTHAPGAMLVTDLLAGVNPHATAHTVQP